MKTVKIYMSNGHIHQWAPADAETRDRTLNAVAEANTRLVALPLTDGHTVLLNFDHIVYFDLG